MKNENIKVYSRFNNPPSNFIDSSSHTRPTFELDENGDLKQIGEVDFFEQIQSYRGLYDVKSIVARYNMGDATALGTPSNTYLDNTGVSLDLRDYTQAAIEQKLGKAYAGLPDDIRSNFVDINDFAKSLGDGSFIDRLNSAARTTTQSESSSSSTSEGGNN